MGPNFRAVVLGSLVVNLSHLQDKSVDWYFSLCVSECLVLPESSLHHSPGSSPWFLAFFDPATAYLQLYLLVWMFCFCAVSADTVSQPISHGSKTSAKQWNENYLLGLKFCYLWQSWCETQSQLLTKSDLHKILKAVSCPDAANGFV